MLKERYESFFRDFGQEEEAEEEYVVVVVVVVVVSNAIDSRQIRNRLQQQQQLAQTYHLES